MTAAGKPRTVRCPACGGASEYSPDNPWRPFCCERCKNHDFGAWASERYRVIEPPPPGAEPPEGDPVSRH